MDIADGAGPMSSEVSDLDLVELVRVGDRRAFGELWRRHSDGARRFARSYTSKFDPDDLVAEAFARVLANIRDRRGPQSGFRGYLLTTVRYTANEWGRARREFPTDQLDEIPSEPSAESSALGRLDRRLTLQAFLTLPERWQRVLWQLEVEERGLSELAAELGMRPNAVSAVAYRAREAFRAAWIQQHLLAAADRPECQPAISKLAGYVRGTLSPRNHRMVVEHLTHCADCPDALAEVRRVDSWFGGTLIALIAGVVLAVGGLSNRLRQSRTMTDAAAKPRWARLALASVPVTGALVTGLILSGPVVLTIGAVPTPVESSPRYPAPRSAADDVGIDPLVPRDGTPVPTPDDHSRVDDSTVGDGSGDETFSEDEDEEVDEGRGPGAVIELLTLPLRHTVTLDDGAGWLLPIVSGTSAAQATVTVVADGAQLAEVTASADGSWVTEPLDVYAMTPLTVQHELHGVVLATDIVWTNGLSIPTYNGVTCTGTARWFEVFGPAGEGVLVSVAGAAPAVVEFDEHGLGRVPVSTVGPTQLAMQAVSSEGRTGPRSVWEVDLPACPPES